MRRNSRPLLVILAISLGLTGFLAYRAWDAAHRRRWDAVQTLREYAGFAAWEIAISVKEQLYAQFVWMFSPVNPAAPLPAGARLPGAEVLVSTLKPSYRCDPDSDASVFRVDLRSGRLETAGPPFTPAFAAWIKDTVMAYAPTGHGRDFTYSALSGSVSGERRSIILTVKWDEAGNQLAAYGAEFCLARIARPIYEKIISVGHVLPPNITRGLPNDSIFSVVVRDAAGGLVAESRRHYASDYVAGHLLDAFGGVDTRVTLRPDIAEVVYPEGLPRSNLPLVVASLTLALALVLGGAMLLRREDELQRLRTDFIASVSHELRTPLAQLRMFAETLLLGRVRNDAERTRSLEIIDQEARRLSHLVENILQFSRAERQAVVLSRAEQPLAPLLRETVEVFQPVARARQVSVTSALAEDAIAKVDPAALRQIVLNLLDNAVKYGPAGQAVHVALKCVGDAVRVSVEDEGPGIPASDRVRIWKAFQRLERDVNSAVAGSGIGLAVVCELVLAHEGRAWIETPESGRGARFVVELPRRGAAA
ncbi:MAG: HAMP domain-containing histidine kinase [Gemmatimonadaceae bacterium]|nr:HAMP domain-containing histidine kinase [Gemmatimonadaceae bacterium]MCW5825468.1 HAMP domain-containing histidine kinase [Gemmatimonadaceae bacterium]